MADCSICGRTKVKRRKQGKQYQCLTAANRNRNRKQYRYTKRLRIAKKEFVIDYLGGKCILCGYSKCQRALHCHHVDETTKDMDRHSLTTLAYSKLEEELKKCVLLCSNCHMEVHDDITSLPDWAMDDEKRNNRRVERSRSAQVLVHEKFIHG
jgi:hypothetical protein